MNRNIFRCCTPCIKDRGNTPCIVNMDCLAKQNKCYRTALWTGSHLQVTLMCIPVHRDIGLEIHDNVDQFIRIEDGCALLEMGESKNNLNCRKQINRNYAVIIPAGTWHNIINIGKTPLKLYSIYAPPQHPFGTIDEVKPSVEKYR